MVSWSINMSRNANDWILTKILSITAMLSSSSDETSTAVVTTSCSFLSRSNGTNIYNMVRKIIAKSRKANDFENSPSYHRSWSNIVVVASDENLNPIVTTFSSFLSKSDGTINCSMVSKSIVASCNANDWKLTLQLLITARCQMWSSSSSPSVESKPAIATTFCSFLSQSGGTNNCSMVSKSIVMSCKAKDSKLTLQSWSIGFWQCSMCCVMRRVMSKFEFKILQFWWRRLAWCVVM